MAGAAHVLRRRAARPRRRSSAACDGDIGSGTGGVGTPSDASCVDQRARRDAGLGLLVDAVERRDRALGEERRHLLVGGDHQVLDQPVRLGLLADARPRRRCRCGRTRTRGSALTRSPARRALARAPRSAAAAARAAPAARAHGSSARSLAGEDRGRPGRSRGARRSGSASGRRRLARPRRPCSSNSTVTARRSDAGTQRAGVVGQRLGQHRLDGAGHVDARRAAVAPRGRPADPGRTYAQTSAMWTQIRHAVVVSSSAEIASSKSCAVAGSIVNVGRSRRSRRGASPRAPAVARLLGRALDRRRRSAGTARGRASAPRSRRARRRGGRAPQRPSRGRCACAVAAAAPGRPVARVARALDRHCAAPGARRTARRRGSARGCSSRATTPSRAGAHWLELHRLQRRCDAQRPAPRRGLVLGSSARRRRA